MNKYSVVIGLTLIALTGWTWSILSYGQDAQVKSNLIPENEVTVEATSQTIGSLFMIGHWANTPLASTTELIQKYQVGGVIIMSAPEDKAEIVNWTKEWQAVSSSTLLIAIDQEGGPVSRLRGENFINTSQAEISDTKTAYAVGLKRGKELSELGINLNFAPVLDSADTPDSFMYDRVFRDRKKSPDLAASMLAGLAEGGVFGVVKHFPGHLDNKDDSHTLLPVVDISQSELNDFVYPFAKLLEIHPPQALMTAHVKFPKLSDQPATLSSFFLTDLLRKELNYRGVIITDDLVMQAISNTWTVGQASVMTLKAGGDLILLAAEPTLIDEAMAEVKKSIASGELTRDEIEAHIKRIDILRNKVR
jgi:beta-N-acetylhexosaminidase